MARVKGGDYYCLIGWEHSGYEREAALCCTAPIIRLKPDMAVEFQEKNVRDAIDCGADALITLCPVCDRVMRRPTGQLGLTKTYITDLCRIALGEKVWPTGYNQ